jgi:hypothetical protein
VQFGESVRSVSPPVAARPRRLNGIAATRLEFNGAHSPRVASLTEAG